MQVTLQYATEHLEELASAADNGEDVEIARPEKPALKLVVSPTVPQAEPGSRINWNVPERPRSELFGSMAHKIAMSPDWDSDETNLQIEQQFEGYSELQDDLPK